MTNKTTTPTNISTRRDILLLVSGPGSRDSGPGSTFQHLCVKTGHDELPRWIRRGSRDETLRDGPGPLTPPGVPVPSRTLDGH
jgi:hypothetical protein